MGWGEMGRGWITYLPGQRQIGVDWAGYLPGWEKKGVVGWR